MKRNWFVMVAGVMLLLQGSGNAYDWKELKSWEITGGASPAIVIHLTDFNASTGAINEVVPLDDTRFCEYIMTALTATKQRHCVKIYNDGGFKKYQFAHFRTSDSNIEDKNRCNFHSFSIGIGTAADSIGHIRIDVSLQRLGDYSDESTNASDLRTFHCYLTPSATHVQKIRFDYLVTALSHYENVYTGSEGKSNYGIVITNYDANKDFTNGTVLFNILGVVIP